MGVLLPVLFVSCRNPDANLSREQSRVIVMLPGDPEKVVCRACPEARAEAVLIAELTIPGLMSQRKYEIPFRREFVYDMSGLLTPRTGPADATSIACGPGGYHHSSMTLIDGDDSPLTLSVYHSWRILPEDRRGKIRQEVPLTFGAPGEELQLGKGAILKISYRQPK